MKKCKRNAFWSFLFSFIPGATEMYMGFMKTGITLFGAFVVLLGIFGVELNMSIAAFFAIALWGFSFFHAINLQHLTQEEIEKIPDDLFLQQQAKKALNEEEQKERKSLYQKIFAWGLIVFGILLLWNVVKQYLAQFISWEKLDDLPKLVVGVLIIIAGIVMIRGKKKALEEEIDIKDGSEKESYEKTDAVSGEENNER